MTALIRYEAARSALAEAHRVDEVKDIRDKAEAMAAYARQAKDQDMILWATEIKVRAERKAGEMLTQAKASGDRASRGKPAADSNSATLHDLGIAPHNATRWQKMASMTEDRFETAVAMAKDTAGQVTTAFMLRAAEKAKPTRGKKAGGKRAKALAVEMQDAQARGVSMLTSYARLTLAAIKSQQVFSQQERELLDELADAIQNAKVLQ
jgi:hypothetical protein